MENKNKYAIILFDEDGSVWRVYLFKKKQPFMRRVAYEVDRYPHVASVSIGTFKYSDNPLMKRARNCEKVFELDD